MLQLVLIRLPCNDAERFWARSGPSESHLAKRGGIRHCGVFIAKWGLTTAFFGERIIKELRCAGACVPVFWLPVCKLASLRMNQGLTPWHTLRETALPVQCTLTLCSWRSCCAFRVEEWGNFFHPGASLPDFSQVGLKHFLHFGRLWVDRLVSSRPAGWPSAWPAWWRSFCRTKRADTRFGKTNVALGVHPKISVSLYAPGESANGTGLWSSLYQLGCVLMFNHKYLFLRSLMFYFSCF